MGSPQTGGLRGGPTASKGRRALRLERHGAGPMAREGAAPPHWEDGKAGLKKKKSGANRGRESARRRLWDWRGMEDLTWLAGADRQPIEGRPPKARSNPARRLNEREGEIDRKANHSTAGVLRAQPRFLFS